MGRHDRRANKSRAGGERRSTVEQFVIHGPFTDAQAQHVEEFGHRSLEAYRTLLYRLRFTEGARRILQTVSDWRVGLPMPPTLWFVEKDHFHGIRHIDVEILEKMRLDYRVRNKDGGYPGSLLVNVHKNELGIGNQVDFFFEHDALDHLEKYVFRLPNEWAAFERASPSAPWSPVAVENPEEAS